jgi:anti-sigma-K factor RskA
MSIATSTRPLDHTTSVPRRDRRTWWHVVNTAVAASAVVIAVVALTDSRDRATVVPAPVPAAVSQVDHIPAYQYDVGQRGRLEREADTLCGTRGLTPPEPC